MKKIISSKDIEELIRKGGDLKSLTSNAILTPSAKDILRDLEVLPTREASARSPVSPKPDASGSDLNAFFHSKDMLVLKEQLCDIGRRLWQRAYVDGNGGNLAIKVADNLALCTPTLISKGFMKPDQMCLVDMEGNQKAGTMPRTSEILMHLQIMQSQPKAKATCHCHPPHATAFAVAGVEPPTCMIPEIEVFIGKVPIAPYLTPGTKEMGAEVAKLVDKHNTVLMANHGVVSWSHNNLEDAYFKMEIIEAYCRTVVVASQLGRQLKTFTPTQLQDLLNIKERLGIPDPRMGLKECELCDNGEWRPGAMCVVPDQGQTATEQTSNQRQPVAEDAVKRITDEIMNRLSGR